MKTFKQKLRNPQAHSVVPRLTIRFVSTHLQKDFNDIRCQQAPDDSAAEIAEGHTFAQSNEQETGKSHPVHPRAESQICTDKNHQDSSKIHFLYLHVSNVFRKEFHLPERVTLNAS